VNIIGIDTSTDLLSVAVIREGLPAVEKTEAGTRNFTERLFVLLDEALNDIGLDRDEIDAVAVSIGPGSFTGVRVGVGSAKGLAYSLNVPVVGVSSFEAMCYGLEIELLPACAVVPYKNDKISYVVYDGVSNGLQDVGIPGTWEDIKIVSYNVAAITGLFSEEKTDFLRNLASRKCAVLPFAPSGNVIAGAGLKKIGELSAGESGAAAALAPLYAHTMKFRERRQKFPDNE